MGDYRSPRTMQENLSRLAENPYPGRGIVIGMNEVGDTAVQTYWVMGRSEGSRARKLVLETDPQSDDGAQLVRTEPHNLPEGTDTSLIIYNAMRRLGNVHVVSNGDQTDTMIDYLRVSGDLHEALDTRSYEPDSPNYTPRISGFTKVGSAAPGIGVEYGLSTIHRSTHSGLPVHTFYDDYIRMADFGVGNCIHTYKGDGNPLPSFDTPPFSVPLGETVDEIASTYWESLNPDNRVALVVKGIKVATGEEMYSIVNIHE